LEAVCLDLQPIFNSFYHPIDYLCRLFLEKNVSDNTKYIMPNFVDKLFKLYPSSTFGYFAQGKILFEHGKVLDAISWLKQGLESKIHQDALELLVTALLAIWDFEGVEEHATRALKLQNLKDPQFFYYALAQGYIGQEKGKETLGTLDNIRCELHVNILKAKVLANDNRWDELDVFLVGMQKYENNWNFDFLRARGKREDLLSLCDYYNDNFNLLLLCGIEFSKMDDLESAIGVFSKVCNFLYRLAPGKKMIVISISNSSFGILSVWTYFRNTQPSLLTLRESTGWKERMKLLGNTC